MSTTNNWANRTKKAVSNVPAGKSGNGPLTRYSGAVENAELRQYRNGNSYGVQLVYKINANGAPKFVYEHIVLKRALTEGGPLEITAKGPGIFKTRLLALGFSSNEINQMDISALPDAQFDLTPAIGVAVEVYCADGEYLGKPTLDVKRVYAADRENTQATA